MTSLTAAAPARATGGSPHPAAGPSPDGPGALAHHFDSPEQQFEAAKLGMWLFLATELLLFGGLFCLYGVYRSNHHEMFEYGSRFLSTRWGTLNTVVLILSSMTMATAVWCAQRDHRRLLKLFLVLTLCFAGDFLLIKYIEYAHKFHDNLVWGVRFYQEPAGTTAPVPAGAEGLGTPPAGASAGPDAAAGSVLWTATCRACHGLRGEGVEGRGKDLRGSAFIGETTDEDLVAFIKAGRAPADPLNTTGLQMPPRGGNPLLGDEDLRNLVAYLRTLEESGPDAPPATGGGAPAGAGAGTFWIPRWSVPPAARGPAGLAALGPDPGPPPPSPGSAAAPIPRGRDPHRPANAHIFFGIYFIMTGLHGLHVVAGMVMITWLLIGAGEGRFGAGYFTPVDLGGLYWHVVDMIWIFLFPLFYLIS